MSGSLTCEGIIVDSISRIVETALFDYLQLCAVPNNRSRHDENQKEVLEVFCGRMPLIQKGLPAPLRCIAGDEVTGAQRSLCSRLR